MLLYEETKDRAEKVSVSLREIHGRIEGAIRFNLILLGLLVTGLSFLVRSGRPSSSGLQLTFLLLAVGAISLVISTAVAITAYLEEKVALGVDSDDLYRAVGQELDRRDLHQELLRVYGLAIAEDEEIIEETSRKFRASLYTLLMGLAAVGFATVVLSSWGVN